MPNARKDKFTAILGAVILILAAIGAVGMWAAVFADVGVSIIAILNAMRTLNARAK